MLIERGRIRVANAGSMDIGLISEDQGGGDGVHRLPDVTLVFMRTDRAHHDRRVFRRCAEPLQDPMSE